MDFQPVREEDSEDKLQSLDHMGLWNRLNVPVVYGDHIQRPLHPLHADLAQQRVRLAIGFATGLAQYHVPGVSDGA